MATSVSPSIAAMPDGSAVVSWMVQPEPAGGGVAAIPARIVVQQVFINGELGEPRYFNPPGDGGTSFRGGPAIAVDPDGKAMVIASTLETDGLGLWLAHMSPKSNAVWNNAQWQVFGPVEQLAKVGTDSLPLRPYDIAMNGDGWGIVTVGFAPPLPSRMYRVPPSQDMVAPPHISFGEPSNLPRVSAATCVDDAVALTPSASNMVVERYRFLADDDDNGVADTCCD